MTDRHFQHLPQNLEPITQSPSSCYPPSEDHFSEQQKELDAPIDDSDDSIHEFQYVEAFNNGDTDPSSPESNTGSDSGNVQFISASERREAERLADEMLAQYRFFQENDSSEIEIVRAGGDGKKSINFVDAIARLATSDEITHRVHLKNYARLLGTSLLYHFPNAAFMMLSCSSIIKRMNFLVKSKKMLHRERNALIKDITIDVESFNQFTLKQITLTEIYLKVLKYVKLAESIMIACKLGSPTFMQRNGSEKAQIKNIKQNIKIGKLSKTLKCVEFEKNGGPDEEQFLSTFRDLHPERADSVGNWSPDDV